MTEIDYVNRSARLMAALISAEITLEVYGLTENSPASCRLRIEKEIAKIRGLLGELRAETDGLLSDLTLALLPDAKAA